MRNQRQNENVDESCYIDLRSRVWIVMRLTENDSTRLYSNGDISVVIRYS